MGLFNSNRGYLGLDYDCGEIVANENYTHEFGFGQMLVDNAQNDMAIFEALIAEDFKEVMAVQEGVEYVNEASLGGFFDKIKEFLKKAWEKITGIIKSFMTKFIAMFIRDNGELVKKYEKEVRNKENYNKMKYKWVQYNEGELSKVGSSLEKYAVDPMTSENALENSVSEKDRKALDEGTYLEGMLSEILGTSTTEADFDKDFFEKVAEDAETEEGLSGARIDEIIDILKNAKAAKKDMDDMKSKIDKYFKKSLSAIDSAKKTVEGKLHGTAKDAVTKKANYLYKKVSVEQKGINILLRCTMSVVKAELAQARRVFVQAAAYRPVKEDAILFDAIGECAEFDILD